MKRKFVLIQIVILSAAIAAYPQTGGITLKGSISNKLTGEPIVGASIIEKNGSNGTTSDGTGSFSLTVQLPVTLVFSSAEFETLEILLNRPDEAITIGLEPVSKSLADVTVESPTRTRMKLSDIPVSVELMGIRDFINSPSASFYNALLSKKGLDVTVSSATYLTYSTRGFNASGSSKVTQLMDGMDNQAPGMNFNIGSFIGLTDLDVESVEILPGASSALYGPGGTNGTILIKSKSPFSYPGFAFTARQGVMDIGSDQRKNPSSLYDYSFRWAKSFRDRFAFKIGAQFLQTKDWLAMDSSNYLRLGTSGQVIAGNRRTDPNYDGVNVYGDETSLDVRSLDAGGGQLIDLWYLVGEGIKAQAPPIEPGIDAVLALTPAALKISRTGYHEKDVIDPIAKNIKLSGALHYKLNEKLEAQLVGFWGTGNTVYTGNNRYALKDIRMGQYKLELKHRDWFIRGYTTQENAGEAYSATVNTQYFNEAWKPSGAWYQQYAEAFLVPAAKLWLQTYGGALANGETQQQATNSANNAVLSANSSFHNSARAFADMGRPEPGSDLFRQMFDSVRKVPIPTGGKFVDQSDLWMAETQYNFSNKIKFAELIAGANLKKYVLNSQGTIFIDTAGALEINEWGAYAQLSKKLFNDAVILSASGRYDKNQNFKGKFTPRFTALIKPAKNHSIRLSYQTAYKFPTTQQQWIKLDVGDATLLGGLPWIEDVIEPGKYPTLVYDPATGNTTPYSYKEFKPESLRSFEIGYKGFISNKLMMDMYAYVGTYTDFLGRIILIQPTTTNKPYSIVTNSDSKLKTYGFGFGIDYNIHKNFMAFFNAYSDQLTNVPTGFEAGFNTPKYRLNAGFGNTGIGKNERIGFNTNLRWQEGFFWEGGGFANGNVKSYTTLDAQVSYKFPSLNSVIKLGGTNILNKQYLTGFGNPSIGGMYYASFAFNVLNKSK